MSEFDKHGPARPEAPPAPGPPPATPQQDAPAPAASQYPAPVPAGPIPAGVRWADIPTSPPPPGSHPGVLGWPATPVPRGPAPVTWKDALGALVVALVVATLGAPLALLWSAVGPHVTVVMTSAGPMLEDYNTEAFAGGDVTFGAIAAGAGALVGASAWAVRRWRGPTLLVGLALGGVAGSWIMWKLGQQIGLSEYRDLVRNADVGQRFGQPMKLRAQGLVFLLSTVAVIVYVVNAAWSHRADLGTPAADPVPDAGPHPQYAGPPRPTAASATDGATHLATGTRTAPGGNVSSGPLAPAAPPEAPAPPATGSASSPPA